MAAACFPLSNSFALRLNGSSLLVRDEAAQVTLLDFIRSRGLTGAKEGCAEGECGACAVLLVSKGAQGTTYRSVNSCLIPLPAMADQEIYTVESLAENGKLAEVQQALVDHGGSQCGYCTPGFVVSMFAEQYGSGGERDAHALGGNLCRCTGYRAIRDALRSLGPAPPGAFRDRLALPAPGVEKLHYATSRGRFSRPGSLEACIALAQSDPNARFVAGNTDVGILTNLRDERFAHLIALEGVAELREFRDGSDAVEIGAALTLTEIAERWDNPAPIFHQWLPLFASVLIRNRATLGGNLATASPIGDAAPMLLALDAQVRIQAATSERIIPLNEFFTGYRRTSLGRADVLRSVIVPKPFPAHARFFKVAKRSLDDISTVAAGISFDPDSGTARLAFGGVAATPMRAIAAEQALSGGVENAKAALRRTLRPIGDHRGSAAYRLALAQSLLDKYFFERASA